jgi:nucleoside-diphosphate-sugar epimerase
VARNPKSVNPTDELMPADLLDGSQVDRAVAGSEVVYVTVGFPYSTKVWQQSWPPLINNVVAACQKHGAKLVFFDNVYMYDRSAIGHMTEESPINPPSEKGKVRAQIADTILSEVEKGTLTALVARSADFYGPGGTNSVLQAMVTDNLKKGKKSNWPADADKIHNFTYTPDAAKATALLGNTPDAYNQVWHLPTDSTPLTGRQWAALFTEAMSGKAGVQVMPAWLVGALSIFIPFMGEFKPMLYQYDQNYFFDSSKFSQRFDFATTTPQQAVDAIVGVR